MGDLFKKTTTTFQIDGRRVPTGTPGAVRVTQVSKKWYGTINGKQMPLCRDKAAARTMFNKLLTDDALAGVGIVDPYADHRKRPLADHLADYAAELERRGNSADHVRQTLGRVRALFAGCEFKMTDDVNAGRAVEWLAGLRRGGSTAPVLPDGRESFTPNEVAKLLGVSGAALRSAVKRHALAVVGQGKARRLPRASVAALADRAGRGCGPETMNHYVRSARGFFRWMVRDKRIGANPLDTLSVVSATTDVRRLRRELTADELRRLLAATRASGRTFRGLTANDRFMVCLTAAGTGFRSRSLANLTRAEFDLDGDSPTVTLAARFNKSKRSKVQPLPVEIADELRTYLRGQPQGRTGSSCWAMATIWNTNRGWNSWWSRAPTSCVGARCSLVNRAFPSAVTITKEVSMSPITCWRSDVARSLFSAPHRVTIRNSSSAIAAIARRLHAVRSTSMNLCASMRSRPSRRDTMRLANCCVATDPSTPSSRRAI